MEIKVTGKACACMGHVFGGYTYLHPQGYFTEEYRPCLYIQLESPQYRPAIGPFFTLEQADGWMNSPAYHGKQCTSEQK